LVPVKHGKFTCPRCNYPIDSQNDNNFNPEHTWIQCPDCGYRQTTNLFF
jgi:transcription elongation factor Elf1